MKSELDTFGKLKYPNDPLRIDPTVKQYSNSGSYIYVDTCDHCTRYIRSLHACCIRDSNSITVAKMNGVSNPLSVNAGYKCKHWRGIKQ